MSFFAKKHSRCNCPKCNLPQKQKDGFYKNCISTIASNTFFQYIKTLHVNFFNSIKYKAVGATLIEYTLIASLIVVMLMASYKGVGNGYSRIYNRIANAI